MGIRGLTSLIKKHVPDALQVRSLNYFSGSRVAVDTSILLYKFRYSGGINKNENSHITGFLNKCLCYIKHGIIPIFIIDGKPPPEKSLTIQKRYKHRQRLEERIKDLEKQMELNQDLKEDIKDQISRLDKQIITVNKEHHQETKNLLKLLGFEVIVSPGEAEEVCVHLQKRNIVDFTYSDDTDVLALGCPLVLRSNGKVNYLTEINLNKVLTGLDLTFEQFVDVCILCGCDYCPNIPRLNYQKAYDLIKRYKSINHIPSDIIPKHFNYKDARKIFNKEINESLIQPINIKTPTLDVEGLQKFLEERNFNKKYIDRYVKKFENALLIKFSNKTKIKSENFVNGYFKNLKIN